MRIMKVEPTPSPNSMKLTLDVRLNRGVRLDYKKGGDAAAPSHIRRLLAVPGVTGVFQTADFLALERHPQGDWPTILAAAEEILGVAARDAGASEGGETAGAGAPQDESRGYGEVAVLVQTFRGIPMQVRVSAGLNEKRAALPDRFQKAAQEAGMASPNLIMERRLEDRGVRYGELEAVLDELVKELEAAYGDARLRALVDRSLASKEGNEAVAQDEHTQEPEGPILETVWSDPDWRVRYAALDRLTPGPDTLPQLARALRDAHVSVRRLAVVYMGDIKEPDSLPYLLGALQDPSPIIRRTAGDTLSDRGDPAAVPAMEAALKDPNKLVRWRAARFLFELADDSSLSALEAAKHDPEFEVRLQVRLAIERIQGGEEAQGTVWQQMTRRNDPRE